MGDHPPAHEETPRGRASTQQAQSGSEFFGAPLLASRHAPASSSQGIMHQQAVIRHSLPLSFHTPPRLRPHPHTLGISGPRTNCSHPTCRVPAARCPSSESICSFATSIQSRFAAETQGTHQLLLRRISWVERWPRVHGDDAAVSPSGILQGNSDFAVFQLLLEEAVRATL